MKAVALAIVNPRQVFLCYLFVFVMLLPQRATATGFQGLSQLVHVRTFNQQLISGMKVEPTSLSFSSDMMNGIIMAPNGHGGFTALFSFHDLIDALVSAHNLIHPIDGLKGRLQGFSMQRPGLTLTNVLFRREGNQLFLEAGGQERTKRKFTENEQAFMLLRIRILYSEATKQAFTLYPPIK